MEKRVEIKVKKLRTFLLFVVLQCLAIFAGIFLWSTVGGLVDKITRLWQTGDMEDLPTLLAFMGQILLFIIVVFFAFAGLAFLFLVIRALILDVLTARQSEDKKFHFRNFLRFYRKIILE